MQAGHEKAPAAHRRVARSKDGDEIAAATIVRPKRPDASTRRAHLTGEHLVRAH